MHTQTYQIVFIRHDQQCLYGELIQTVIDRATCWVRPIALCIESPKTASMSVLDVRNGPDIICPSHLPQPVLDEDWLSLLEKLGGLKEVCDFSCSNTQLKQFLKAVFSG